MEFTGFPVAAFDFYDDLEVDNTKSYWAAHKGVYEEAVLAPMKALTAALEPEFGAVKIFRPYRDVRFAKDKTPYKTHQGAFVASGPATGWYVEIAPRGMRVGAGFYEASGPRLTAVREAVADDKTGPALRRTLTKLEKAGFEITGQQLKTTPRGYDAGHPRIDLLRHRTLTAGKSYGFADFIHTAELLEHVREDWRALKPLVSWLERAFARAD
ncbi:TIGR02453 family protein [Nocardioides lijunqiniae]|uniref:TIGR02453 family protein n=1 Tax=Nocardioides lijunqiniae TaxID=2760832 RepID=UPI0018781448